MLLGGVVAGGGGDAGGVEALLHFAEALLERSELLGVLADVVAPVAGKDGNAAS